MLNKKKNSLINFDHKEVILDTHNLVEIAIEFGRVN